MNSASNVAVGPSRSDGSTCGMQIFVLDIKAVVNTIKFQTIRNLHKAKGKHAVNVEPPLVRLTGLDSENHPVLGRTLLSFTLEVLQITATFYVTQNFSIPGDILLGLEDMAKFILT